MTRPTGEAERLRRDLFREPILGLGPAEEWAIVGRAMAARDAAHGHDAGTVRALLEGLAWGELGPTALARDLVEVVMGRVDAYCRGLGGPTP